MNILLHTCCAPCSIKCIQNLKNEGIFSTIFWYNPNIHPFKEYDIRKKTLIKYARSQNVEYLEKSEYGLRDFISEIYPHFGKKRCEYCYEKRLSETAKCAVKKGFEAFSTTLLISPYQNHELIKKIGEKTEKKYNVKFLYRDFRPYFFEGQNEAREIGLYMQKYCGCIFSEEERYMGEIIKDSENQSFLKLLKPSTMFKNQIMDYRNVFLKAGEIPFGSENLELCESYEEWADFDKRLRETHGKDYKPVSVYLAVRKSDSKLVGIINLRHKLTEYAEKFEGNISYSVLPEERGKGYEKEMLKLILLKCKKYGIDKAWVMCDKFDKAFSDIIISNGGIFQNEVVDELNRGKSGFISRYTIDIK